MNLQPSLKKLLVLFTAIMSSLSICVADDNHHHGGSSNNFSLTYLGRVYNSSSDYTEFSYRLCGSEESPDLSHFLLGVPDCSPDLRVITYGLDRLADCDRPSQPSVDGSTRLYGVKWDDCDDFDDDCDTFSIKLAGNKAEGPVTWLAKAGNCQRSNTCSRGTTTGPICGNGDLPPVCVVDGPFNVPCGNGSGAVTVSGAGSYDPSCSRSNSCSNGDNCALTYSWITTCPNGVIDNPVSATPAVTFSTVHYQNVSQSCSMFLTVKDSSNQERTCEAIINVGQCQFDCLGVLGGSAVLDDCGVCNGTNAAKDSCGVCFGGNRDLDTCGVCFGNNQAKDRCGVCFGDGSSCSPTCEETNIFGDLLALDNLAAEYLAFIKNLGKKLKKATSKKHAGKLQVARANGIYNKNWELSWSLPQIIQSNCNPSQLCVTVSYVSEFDEYKSNHDQFGVIAAGLIDRLTQAGVDTTILKNRKAKLDRADNKLIVKVPKLNEVCD